MAENPSRKRSKTDEASTSSSNNNALHDEKTYPTFVGTIAGYFRDMDKNCMRWKFDLGNYRDVRNNAGIILEVVERGSMPTDAPWSAEKVETFRRWARQGCKYRHELKFRVRKNINSLSTEELGLLKQAFVGLQKQDKDGNSPYAAFCDIHANYCLHHLNGFYTWHRLFMQAFEDALRQVPGCEEVTLPYWDFTEDPLPEVLQHHPFKKYVSPSRFDKLNIGMHSPAACEMDSAFWYRSVRNQSADVNETFAVIKGDVYSGLVNNKWAGFTGWDHVKKVFMPGTVHAHDFGHNNTGKTMRDSRYSPFDPIFFFFHCNFDRIWWTWQCNHQATSVDGFVKTLTGNTAWVQDGGLIGLRPFVLRDGVTGVFDEADDYASHASTIDLETAFNVRYDSLITAHTQKAAGITLKQFSRVTVSGINRLKISGNFTVQLTVDDKHHKPQQIAVLTFLQPPNPPQCPNCSTTGTVSFEFYVPPLNGQVPTVNIRQTVEGAENLDHSLFPNLKVDVEDMQSTANGQELKMIQGPSEKTSFMVAFDR